MSATLSDGVRKLFQGKNIGHIGTLMPDGSPQVSPVWIGVEGDMVLVNSDETAIKVKNLRRDSRVAISIVDNDDPYRSVHLRGRVVEFRHAGARAHIDQLAKEYRDMEEYQYHYPGEQRVIMVIEPERVAAMGTD